MKPVYKDYQDESQEDRRPRLISRGVNLGSFLTPDDFNNLREWRLVLGRVSGEIYAIGTVEAGSRARCCCWLSNFGGAKSGELDWNQR